MVQSVQSKPMLNGLIKFVFFFAIVMIVALPTFMAFYGPGLHRQHTHVFNSNGSHHDLSSGGHHDTSWELIKKRHMSAPPVLSKVRVLLAVSLLFSLFSFDITLALSNLSLVNYTSRKKPFPRVDKYIVLSSFLI